MQKVKDFPKRPQTSQFPNKELWPPKNSFLFSPIRSRFPCRCCLFYLDYVVIGTRKQVPLRSLFYEVEIIESLAQISITQDYFNDDPSSMIETEFLFSIANEACFYDFEAQIGDILIKGEIMEKKEAQLQFKENLFQGNMVAYSEISSDQPDIMKIKVGNIPPLSPVKIRFRYLQPLDICMNKFWRLTIPSTLTPRYNSRHQTPLAMDKDVKNLNNLPQIKESNPNKYPWNIKTTITSSSPITFLKSPSHSIITEFLDKNQTKCLISFQNDEFPNKDYTILFKNEGINKPSWTLAHNEKYEENPYCAMITFFPGFNKASDSDAYDAFLQNSVKNDFKISALKTKGEFIFLLDRSGSMKGRRIEMAKRALILFLKSMPADSHFNIVSFGSLNKHSFLFAKQSKKYSEELIETTIKEIQDFEADLGGTELYPPLSDIFRQKIIAGYPRNVFLLTDGAISNTKQVIDLIASNNELCRVNTIGIGNGCSRELIIEGAKAGNGKYEFIGDNEDMNGKIVGLLQDSLTPFLTNISLKFEKNLVEMITPLPESILFLKKNEALTFHVYLKKQFSEVTQTIFTLSYTDSLQKDPQNEEIIIKITDLTLQEDILHRFGMFKMIKTISSCANYHRDYNQDVYIAKKRDIEEFCLSNALKYQIMTSFTAFICVINERDPQNDGLVRRKVEIPSLVSIDHSQEYGQGNEERTKVASVKCKMSSNVRTTQDVVQLKKSEKMIVVRAAMKSEKKITHEEQKKNEIVDISLTEESKNKEEKGENAEDLMKILAKQKMGGFWELKSGVIELMALSSEKIMEKKPESMESKEVWLTIIVLGYLETNFPKSKDSWILISEKAKEFLEENGVDYENFKKTVSEFFQGTKK